MKIALITDTHFGARNDSRVFSNNFYKFYEDIFFPKLKELNVSHCIHLGDFCDRRKYINYFTLNEIRTRFLDVFEKNDISIHALVGNHDTFYKNTNDINCFNELFNQYSFIKVYDKPRIFELYGIRFGMVPWITDENRDECIDFIQNCSAEFLCGHFEVNGFEIISGMKFGGGLHSKLFKNYDKVFSGHFHNKQIKGNIWYLGTPYQITWSDYGMKHGFHILDTETREIEFIENTHTFFVKYEYDDSEMEYEDLEDIDFTGVEERYVKIIVNEKKNPFLFDKYIDRLYKFGPANISIIEDISIDDEVSEEDEIDMKEDTLTMINHCVDQTLSKRNERKRLKGLLQSLYMEAVNMGERG